MHRPRILLVDDDPLMRELISRRLTDWQYEVWTAGSGEDCLRLTGREHPDLVLLDASMPDCDPAEIARQLRSEPATRSIPIIMLSTFDDANGNGSAPAADADDFAAKPFSPDLLLSRIRDVLERHGP